MHHPSYDYRLLFYIWDMKGCLLHKDEVVGFVEHPQRSPVV